MTKKSQTVGTLVKTRDLSDEELSASIDRALDALFGKEEEGDAKKPSTKNKKPSPKKAISKKDSERGSTLPK